MVRRVEPTRDDDARRSSGTLRPTRCSRRTRSRRGPGSRPRRRSPRTASRTACARSRAQRAIASALRIDERLSGYTTRSGFSPRLRARVVEQADHRPLLRDRVRAALAGRGGREVRGPRVLRGAGAIDPGAQPARRVVDRGTRRARPRRGPRRRCGGATPCPRAIGALSGLAREAWPSRGSRAPGRARRPRRRPRARPRAASGPTRRRP